jgi:hypothetical protein
VLKALIPSLSWRILGRLQVKYFKGDEFPRGIL